MSGYGSSYGSLRPNQRPKRLPLLLTPIAQAPSLSPSNEIQQHSEAATSLVAATDHSADVDAISPSHAPTLHGRQRIFYSDLLSQPTLPRDGKWNSEFVLNQISSPQLERTVRRNAQKTPVPPITPGKGGQYTTAVASPTKSQLLSPALENYVLEPKVMLSYESRPGQTPRKIEIERKKRLFSQQNIENLLEKAGVPSPATQQPVANENGWHSRGSFLPLALFDNTSFETRTVYEWLAYPPHFKPPQNGTIIRAKQSVECVALYEWRGAKAWRRSRVIAYDEERNLWHVAPSNAANEEAEAQWIHRIDLMFLAEDPFLFANRVADAHKRRAAIEAGICLQFYIDAMPTDGPGVAQLSDDAVKRILLQSMGALKQQTPAKTKTMLASPWFQLSGKEIKIDYTRTMNAIAFDAQVRKPENKEIYKHLTIPDRDPVVKCSWTGRENVPEYDYEQQRKDFRFSSFLTNLEVTRTLIKLRVECERLAITNLFATNHTKSVRLDEFEQMQTAAINSVKNMLKDTWTTTMKTTIKNGLRDVGKGWFNMSERSIEVYRISKLRKFMSTVRFIMEDSLRYLMQFSLQEYVKLIAQSTAGKVQILGTNQVRCDKANDGPATLAKKPLFLLDLVFREGKVMYNIDLNQYENVLIALFDKAITAVEGLPQLEPIIMDQLFWSTKPNLETVNQQEKFVVQLRDRLRTLIRDSIEPLEAYLRQYDKHLKLMNLEPSQYMLEYDAENHTNEEMERDIIHHMQEWEALDRDIPNYVSVGMFWVNCESVRAALRKDLSRVILDLFAKRASKTASGISLVFTQIQQRLKERPQKIEELVELREYIENLTDTLKQQKINIGSMLEDYEKLERFKYDLANEDFKAKWLAYSWPAKIDELIKQTLEQLDIDQATFLKNMLSDQEVFKERIHQLNNVVTDFSKHTDIERVNEIVLEVHKVSLELKECASLVNLFTNRERLFHLEPNHYDEVATLAKDFEPYRQMWLTTADWIKWRQAWLHGPFMALNAEEVDKNLSNAWRTMFKSVKTFKQIPGCLAVATRIKDEMDEFKPYLPLIQALRNPGMRDRHWDRLSQELNIQLHPDDSHTLTKFLQMNLLSKIDSITKICDVAGKEYSIEASLDKMENEWRNISLEILPYRETGTYIMKVSDEALRLLDDHIVMAQSMSFSPFRKPFQERITSWESRLRTVQEVLEEWMMCQRSWLYLEPIFSSEDIARQLPTETKRFVTMDRMWRKLLLQAKARPGLVDFCADNKLLEQFHECNKLLEQVAKGLSAYLESKRLAFPRFFFLSDDELLQILSQTKDPTAVQPHLRKCFENIARLEFQKDNLITTMFAADGESVPFTEAFYPTSNVEDWLGVVEQSMKRSVKDIVHKAILDYDAHPRTEWVTLWPGQAVLAASQTHWTTEVAEAIKFGLQGLKAHYRKQLDQLEGLVRLVRGDLKPLTRLVLGDLIVIDVHARDVVMRLLQSEVQSVNDFEWMSQLRYYWEDDDLRVKIVNANFKYGYEYLGNTGRLVITPLTDRCYLTLTGAMHLTMGGAPAGPAGTGKTETVKDLAKSLAKQCVVFNCSDQLDYLAMAKFFKGLASSGAWACFDEFNRIDIEVLSVIAQQITTIQKAITANMTRFMFEGVEIGLDPTNAIFITMNPGYAGRTELPDNLKALFRPVAMMIPDYAMIAEISLFSFGFSDARNLAQKMVATFKLSSEQLSSQDHYDFGMRAVKTVISSAGNLKRASPDDPEDLLLLRALCDVNLPKFLAEDVPLFNGIISDLFPGVTQPAVDYGKLLESIHRSCFKFNVQSVEPFIKKCIQLYETTVVRHGLMLVGPTGGGKTSCYRVLADAISNIKGQKAPGNDYFTNVQVYVLNPKSITMGQLYGEFDAQTHEWTDGILSNLVREGTEDTGSDKKWYVFDGPVDAVWIESMNTVLDDNKKLCLSSGEIIKLLPTQKMVFEVENLAYASPATVSRCGMVYMEPTALGTAPLIKSWLTSRKAKFSVSQAETMCQTLQSLFDANLQNALEFLRHDMIEVVPTTNGNLTLSLMRLIDSLILEYATFLEKQESGNDGNERVDRLPDLLEPMFYFALIWSLGATCGAAGRQKFDKFIREAMKQNTARLRLPEEQSIYDYKIRFDTLEWVNWMQGMTDYVVDPKQSYADIIVPTMDSVRNTFVIHLLLNNDCHVLCTGPTGTAKSVTIIEKLMRGMNEKFTPIVMNFSARTGANQTQDFLDSKMDKRRKGVFGPPVGKKFVIFVDDLNMPALEVYGAQPPIELIRQWMDHKGWYDRKAVGKFMEIVDISFICAMGPPGGGRNPITPRLTRHFNLLSFIEMETTGLERIFKTILNSFLSRFGDEIAELTMHIVSASLDVYDSIRNELLPTPTKSHYTFNLRDLSKVFQGLLAVDMKSINTPQDVVRLWVHESSRVFKDRLINDADCSWFGDKLRQTMQKNLNMTWESVVTSEPLIYGDYLIPGADPKCYVEIKDMKKLVKVAEEYLEDYNSSSTSPMKLVMFLDAIEHVSRICRIIRQPLGNALLLGVGGSGRQSLSRLAAFMAEFETFQIEVSKNYGQNEWRDDLKKVLLGSGLEGKPMVFIFCDTQIVMESFLEDVNNILNAGDVPNIYTSEEIDRVLTGMRSIAQEQGITPTKEALFALFLGRVRQNLHMILCMSPIGEAFRNRLRMFPSLVNCCTIDWFKEWPNEALRSVAATSIAEMQDLGSETVVDGVINLCVKMHQSVGEKCKKYRSELNRYNYVTPKSYLELLSLYKRLFETKKGEINGLKKRTATGLDKLLHTTKEVEVLQEELGAMQPMLIQTSQETEYTMKKIAVDKVKAEEMREIIVKEENEASKKAEETKAIAEDAKRDLDEALPALEMALASLKNLTKNDVIEVRSMQRPPDGVKLVIEAVCIMKGIKPKKVDSDKTGKKVDDYWEPGRALLADPQRFLESLMNFDKDNIPEATVVKIKPYIDSPEFQVDVISRVSKAATSICQWVRAMEKYYHVSKTVAPKRARLKEAQDSLEVTLKALNDLKRRMREAEMNIKEMEKRYLESVAKKEELGRKVEECSLKLARADKLIGGLADEKMRWAATVQTLDKRLGNVVGDILLASGAVAYLGAFTSEYRIDLMHEWSSALTELQIPHSDNVSLMETLGDSVKIRQWELFGLPKESLSRENALIVQYSRRWPLLIDPQGQANKWIRNMEKDAGLEIMKLTDKDFLRSLENAIRFGKPCLLENVGETLDPALEPILLRQTFKQGGSTVIKIGDSIIPHHDDFRFYVTTKLPNPHYSPEISAQVTLLNFTLAPSGLEDQLLALVVANERPDLEEAKNALVISNAKMKKELKDIEDKILYLLSSVQGSPVDDERLIETLAASKLTSAEIQVKVASAEKTEHEIDTTRSGYIPVAVRTRILFFCITELGSIDPMYQYSLNWFMTLFTSAITNSEKSEVLEERLKNLNEYFTFSLYTNVCRSLFEKHKLLFSFLLTIKILMNDGKIDMTEYRFLIAGGTSVPKKLQNPAPQWLSSRAWEEIQMLSTLPKFEGLDETFSEDVEGFQQIFDSSNPHREPLPGKWQTTLDNFQRLLLLRCLRTDRITSGVQDFVAHHLGDRFIEPQSSDLAVVFKESYPWSPLVFVLSPGADPASALFKFADEMRFSKKLNSVSLGQGQGPRAEMLLREGMERGLWVLLQNCHLSPSWMPQLDKIVESITPDKVHRDFRLWLTSMPTPKFPVSILQNGVKMTIEPPNGIKANLMRTYATFNDDFLNSCSKSSQFKKLLFSLSFFHSVVQERRKFGALGWNIPYEFTDGDLRICVRQLKMFLEEYDEIPFKVLKYTVGQINYGGRVTDDWDRRLIMNILEDFYNPKVLDDNHRFSTSEIYYQPPGESYIAYRNYLKQLPIDETTEIFSMLDNANITFAQKETYALFETLLTLMPRSLPSASGAAKVRTRDEILMDQATGILARVPLPFSVEAILAKYPIQYKESMSTVLVQEAVRFNRLVVVIHDTLKNMIKALKGFVVMSESLETMSNSIFINQVPTLWASKAYPSLKPLASWVEDLVARLAFLQQWIDQGIPHAFWISGFFFPQAFLTGTLQNYARKHIVSIDMLSFEFSVMPLTKDMIQSKPEDGCYIYGLFIEGARWDEKKKVLNESRPKELYTEMPVIWLLPVSQRKKPETGIYESPVYKTLTRAGTLSTTGHSTNYVLTIELPSDMSQAHWIKRGVALICSLNY